MTKTKQEIKAELARKWADLLWPDYVSTSTFVLALLDYGTDLEIKPLVFFAPFLVNLAFSGLVAVVAFCFRPGKNDTSSPG